MADEQNRTETRSNVFLAATLHAGSRAVSVRIRNLSPNGALVDGSGLPTVGSKIRLVRGRLAVPGELAWQDGLQAGLTFSSRIDVESWVGRSGHSGQQRVDGVIAALRTAGMVPAGLDEEDSAQKSLPAISSALDQVCEKLALTPGLSIEFAEELLKLDTIAQSLRRLATGKPF